MAPSPKGARRLCARGGIYPFGAIVLEPTIVHAPAPGPAKRNSGLGFALAGVGCVRSAGDCAISGKKHGSTPLWDRVGQRVGVNARRRVGGWEDQQSHSN